MSRPQDSLNSCDKRQGIVLLVTLVLLVVLATLGYTFSSRVAAQRHRNQYLIDYTKAQYGCDSAIKYALATMQDLNPQLVDRPNEPDFSDLYALDEAGYQELLAQWDINSPPAGTDANDVTSKKRDVHDINDINNIGGKHAKATDPNNPDALVIRGPYGPPWPYVTEPVEFEIGPTKIRIEIEDENAKYPLGWALLKGKDVQQEAEAGFENFCELMRLDATQIDALKQQLQQIGDMRPFLMDFKPTTETVRTPVSTPIPAKGGVKRTPRTTVQRKVVPVSEQIAQQTAYFAKLFHSSLIETETLAEPTIVCENRKESALKYMDLWGAQKVNINTAPRPVLEAAFIFGGNEVQVADAVIQQRRQKAITSVQELRAALPRFADSIAKCEKYITTASTVFTIRITAVSGVAKASSVIAITKEGDKVTTIGVIKG
jgi:Type II secretion system (T2SS), protein K